MEYSDSCLSVHGKVAMVTMGILVSIIIIKFVCLFTCSTCVHCTSVYCVGWLDKVWSVMIGQGTVYLWEQKLEYVLEFLEVWTKRFPGISSLYVRIFLFP